MFAVEGQAPLIAVDVHVEDRGVVDEVVDAARAVPSQLGSYASYPAAVR